MSLHLIILDWRPSWVVKDPTVTSLAFTPLAERDLLAQLGEEAAAAHAENLIVVPQFAPDDAYVAAVKQRVPQAQVMPVRQFCDFAFAQELVDELLFVDIRRCPLGGFQFKNYLTLGRTESNQTTHFLALRLQAGGAAERVWYDAQQRVRMVRRLYDGITHLELVGTCASLMNVANFLHLGRPTELTPDHLRALGLSAHVVNRNLVIDDAVLDLGDSAGLLALTEISVERFLDESEDGVRMEAGCHVHPTAELSGPIVLRKNAVVGAGARLIGPVVVGEGAQIGAGAFLSHSAVFGGAQVGEHAILAGEVITGNVEAHTERRSGRLSGADSKLNARALLHANAAALASHQSWGKRLDEVLKRIFDIVVATLGLAALLPLFALTALVIKLTSKGPVFFAHLREGRDGQEFRCWKFRTMVPNAHALQRSLYKVSDVDGPQFKLDNDPRVTWIGGWLRRSNIDELPQLFNVLRGEMSLVGPRPSPFRENQICVPWRNSRLSVRPGITGLWQVCRYDRATGDFHQWIFFDMLYVQHRTVLMDLKILIATVLTLSGRYSIPLSLIISDRKRNALQAGGTSFGSPAAA